MTVDELHLYTNTVLGSLEIWVQIGEKIKPIIDCDYDLENNRLVLKP